jgi:hypothetical protein
MTPGKLADAAAQLLSLNCCDRYRPALRDAVLAGQSASTALGCPESILQNTQGSASTLRSQKFTSANSLSIALSNSASVRILLRWAFSYSNLLRRFASVAFILP